MVSELQISHIGIAVSDIKQSLSIYASLLNDTKPKICEVKDQKVRIAIFGAEAGAGRIELLEPTEPDSPIARFIEKRGEGLHHICLYVDDIEAKLTELEKSGARLIDKSPRIGAEGNRIAFVHPSAANGVLIELEERPK